MKGFAKKTFVIYTALAILLTFSGLTLYPRSAFAAISVDAVSSAKLTTAGTSLSWSHTTASGAVLYVCATQNTANADEITGVTYNGVAMTAVETASGRVGEAKIYRLDSPASGANNVVISSSQSRAMIGGAISYLGADTTGSSGAVNNAFVDPGGASISAAVTTTVANSFVNNCVFQNGNSAQTITPTGTNQTKEWDQVDTLINGNRGAGGEQTTTSTGSYTTSYSSSPNEIMAMAIAEVKPATAVAVTPLQDDGQWFLLGN